jgi:hypothetical protein
MFPQPQPLTKEQVLMSAVVGVFQSLGYSVIYAMNEGDKIRIVFTRPAIVASIVASQPTHDYVMNMLKSLSIGIGGTMYVVESIDRLYVLTDDDVNTAYNISKQGEGNAVTELIMKAKLNRSMSSLYMATLVKTQPTEKPQQESQGTITVSESEDYVEIRAPPTSYVSVMYEIEQSSVWTKVVINTKKPYIIMINGAYSLENVISTSSESIIVLRKSQ